MSTTRSIVWSLSKSKTQCVIPVQTGILDSGSTPSVCPEWRENTIYIKTVGTNMPRKKIPKRAIFLILIAAVVYFFAKTLHTNLDSIRQYDFTISIWYLLAAIIIQMIFVANLGYLRSRLIPWLQQKRANILYANTISRLAKYIPGKVGLIVSKIYYMKQRWIDERQGIRISFQENIIKIVAACIVSIPILLYMGQSRWWINPRLIVAVVVIVGIIIMTPAMSHWIINKLRTTRAKQSPQNIWTMMKPTTMFVTALGYIANAVVNGLFLRCIIQSITVLSREHLIMIIAIWNIAGVIGLFALFAPAGLWVREWVIVVLLQQWLPVEIAIIVSIASRLVISFADLLRWARVCYYKSRISSANQW